ncbi:nuclease-related domain-containing protein [Streptomyces sp. NPDC057445]|uniref:nuclease-related domain-containing protein n=1 Tax=Streptomyces sp. NPDC057445 TaxID=3346136 RepID=UPI00369AD7F0
MNVPRAGALAEERVARYLRERDYSFQVEPDFGTGRHPDYLITAGEHTIVAEVKAFETYGMFENAVLGQVMARSLEDALPPIRKQIKKAAGQLRGLRDRGWPLVVVLDNPAGRPIPFDSHMVLSAMYGDLALQAPLEPDGVLGEFRAVAGRNGSLRNDHPYISAVAVVRREDHAALWAADWFEAHRADFGPAGAEESGQATKAMVAAFAEASKDAPEGDDIYLEVFETLSATSVPLPRDVFNGPRDRRWIPNAARTALVPLA